MVDERYELWAPSWTIFPGSLALIDLVANTPGALVCKFFVALQYRIVTYVVPLVCPFIAHNMSVCKKTRAKLQASEVITSQERR